LVEGWGPISFVQCKPMTYSGNTGIQQLRKVG
jgi:hypothetical protein